jgi:endonuclease YncB( thermonuclease family)
MFARKLLTLALSLGLLSPAPAAERRKHMLKGPIPVSVVRVVDGDTFLARAEVWLGQEITVLVRIRGIDAPEMKARCASERVAANAALDQLAAILANQQVELRNISGEKYFGRVLADVVVEDNQNPATLLLDRAMVRPYAGKKRQPWC